MAKRYADQRQSAAPGSQPAEPADSTVELAAADLEEIYRVAPVGLCFLDRDLRFVRINEFLAAVNGVPVEAHIGRTLREVVPNIADRTEELYLQVIATGQPALNFEVVGRTHAAETADRTWLVSYTPLFRQGEVVGVNTVVQDITARAEAERGLAAARAQLEARVEERTAELSAALNTIEGGIRKRQQLEGLMRAKTEIINQIDGAIHCTDLDGFITDCNEGVEELYGYSASDILGRHESVFMPPGEDRRFQALRNRFATTSERMETSTRIRRKDGEFIRVNLISAPLTDDDDNIVGMWTHSWDATAREQAEHALSLHREALDHVQRIMTMGEMVAGLAHEIRQPLAAIMSYARGCIVRMEAGNVDVDALLGAVQAIEEQGGRASAVVDSLRRFTKKHSATREATDINELVRDAVALWELGDTGTRGRVEVELDLKKGLSSVSIDRVQIEQVMVNLLSNAEDSIDRAGKGEGRIVVKTGAVGSSAVAVAVADTGAGIEAESAGELFEPFVTTKPHSMGMGLSVCRRIVESHGGEISIADSPEGGAEVSFVLPVSG